MANFSAIVLAAGQGTRMKSPLPKGLHPVAGVPMLYRVIRSLQVTGIDEIRVVVGYGEKLIRQVVEPLGVACMRQEQQRGTGDAVAAARPETMKGNVVIVNGDHPLIRAEDIKELTQVFCREERDFSVVTCQLKKPGSLGRIVRNSHQLCAIVEVSEASAEIQKIREVNTGMYITSGEILKEYLPKIQSNNRQNEYYLTDMVSLLQEAGLNLGTIQSPPRVAFGVNSQEELARATGLVFKKMVKEHLKNGVVIIDPKTTYIEESVEIGSGTVIYPGTYLKGRTKIGNYCVIESHCFLLNSQVADSVEIRMGCYFESVEVKSKAVIGPYARLRPQTRIGSGARVGNFVEMKKVEFGDRAKASHLTYLGDAIVGEETNIGCGTITCNYAADKKKYMTKIGKNVFVGSDTQFVAPVNVGDHSYVGSGSTITEDIPSGALGLSRSRQVIKENYTPKIHRESKEK